jgi:hypothetical protein
LENGREFVSINPKQKERQDRDNGGDDEATRVQKNMVEHDIDDDRAKQGEAESDKARVDEQAQSAEHLASRDGVDVAAVEKRADEGAGVSVHFGHRAHEMKKGVGTEDDENEAEQNADDNDDVLHGD